jgi:hypothetical protein
MARGAAVMRRVAAGGGAGGRGAVRDGDRSPTFFLGWRRSGADGGRRCVGFGWAFANYSLVGPLVRGYVACAHQNRLGQSRPVSDTGRFATQFGESNTIP